MRICVTGGAGFIGSHLMYCLRDKGYTVLLIDNLLTLRLEIGKFLKFNK